jgi:hypothetical protein
MKWKLTDTRQAEYSAMIKSAQDLESTIGSHTYRGYKLLDMRQNLDLSLRKWWEEVIKEMAIDPAKDYMIDSNGCIKEIPRNTPGVAQPSPATTELNQSKVGTNATELK